MSNNNSWLGGFLSSSYSFVTGTNDSLPNDSTVNIESIGTLLRNLEDSIVPEQRKKTLANIKELSYSPATHKIIGHSLVTFITIIKTSKGDTEVIKDALQILLNIMSLGLEPKSLPQDSAEFMNADMLLKDSKNVTAILNLLEERDNTIRYHSTQILRILLSTKTEQLQHCILVSPMGIARLMDMLRETKEIALLLLLDLTKSNQEIQKIVAFEAAFEILLSIIHAEGLNEGGIIVQDCLQLINNLISENVSNQNYFRETSCIAKLPPLLTVAPTDLFILTDDKKEILLLTFKLISSLVSGNNPSVHNNQTVLCKHNIMQLVVAIALGRLSNATVRVKALLTLGDLIYGNKETCTAFSVILIPNEFAAANEQATTPSLSRLLIVALNSKDNAERTAACFLYENDEAQMALASTLTPPPTEISISSSEPLSIGTHLLGALFGWEEPDEKSPNKSWSAACILSYIVKENLPCKELILKIPLEIPKPGVPLVNLLTKCMRSLTLASRVQGSKHTTLVKIGLLRLLSLWIDNCANAIRAFLQSPKQQEGAHLHIQGLCALLIGLCFLFTEDDSSSQFNKASLHSIVIQRIGIDHFINKLDLLRKSDRFISAEQGKAELDASDNYYDYDFTVFFKNAFDKIQRHIRSPKPTNSKEPPKDLAPKTPSKTESAPSSEYHEAVLSSYKELIRQQDREVDSLKKRNAELEARLKQIESSPATKSISNNSSQEVEALKQRLLQSERETCLLQEKLNTLQQEKESTQATKHDELLASSNELLSLSQAYNELEKLNAQKDDMIKKLQHQLESKQGTHESERTSLEITQLKQKLALLESNLVDQQLRYTTLEKEQEELLLQLANFEIENTNLKAMLGQMK